MAVTLPDAGIESRQLLIGDVRAPVLIGGSPEAPGEEAVVFVHGNPGRGSDWLPLMNLVTDHARVVAPDMPGFGGAEMRADMDYTVAGYAAHLGRVIDQLGIERVHLVAHDFGGPWSLTWAASNPDRVASVSLLNTGVLLDYTWHRLARVWRTPVVGELFMAAATTPAVVGVLRHDNPGLPASWARRLAEVAAPRGTRRAVLRLYRSTTQQMMDRLVEPLAARDIACQVIWGADDVYIPAELAHRQREPFPSAQVRTIDGAGHWVWLEQLDLVAEHFVPFVLDQLSRSTSTNQRKVPRS